MTDPLAALDTALRSWQRLWLQAHGPSGPPSTSASTERVRRELAGFWAMLAARRHHVTVTGRADAPHPPGAAELMTQVVGRARGTALGEIAPVLVATGSPELRVERSRPGWLLSGVADVLAMPAGATRLATFAIDEGDNELLVLVPVDARGVQLRERSDGRGVRVELTGVELPEADVIGGLLEYARLRDRVAVHIASEALSAATALADPRRFGQRLSQARATLGVAIDSSESAQLAVRSTAVSSAVVHVMRVCHQVAETGESGSVHVERVARAEEHLSSAWHLTRLAALL